MLKATDDLNRILTLTGKKKKACWYVVNLFMNRDEKFCYM